MSDGWISFLGALLGGSITFVPSMIFESYRRHLESRSTAQAFCGEIAAIIEMSEKREYVKFANDLIKRMKETGTPEFPNFGVDEAKDPIFENYIQKLGLFKGELPKNIARFYAQLSGIRVDMRRIPQKHWPDVPSLTKIIEDDLKLWADTEELGKKLIDHLQKEASAAFQLTPIG